MKEKFLSLRNAWTFLVLFMLVTGVIYIGIATPTEASAFGALGAFVLALRHRPKLRILVDAIVHTAEATCMIAFIIVGAMVFGYFLTMTQSTQNLITFLTNSGLNRWAILFLMLFLYLILGCFMDLVAMLLLTVPIVHPLMVQLGFDPIWFAVLVIVMGEVGMVTPPLGMNVFVISKYTRLPVSMIFSGSIPHVIAHLIALGVLVAFPWLITWLPYSMSK